MKIKTLLTLAALLGLSFHVAFAAEEEDTPLSKQMSAMNKSLRTIKRQLADPAKKDDSLALLVKIKGNLEEAKKLEPAKTKDVPAAEKSAYLAKYKEQMDAMAKSFDELETAIKADSADDAKKVIEKLSEQKEKGHKDFAPDEK